MLPSARHRVDPLGLLPRTQRRLVCYRERGARRGEEYRVEPPLPHPPQDPTRCSPTSLRAE
eukprot:1666446-Pleurochrysis_carterae.AAC.1